MKKIAIIGANGKTMKVLESRLANDQNVGMTLMLRHPDRIDPNALKTPIKIVQGDIHDAGKLTDAIHGQDMVLVGLSGELDEDAQLITDAMKQEGVKRLVMILGLGIYDEVPGEFGRWNAEYGGAGLATFKRAAQIIETSSLSYTILRAAWMSDRPDINYEITQKGETFKGTTVTRASLADYMVRLIKDDTFGVNESVGLSEPHTEGDRPWDFI